MIMVPCNKKSLGLFHKDCVSKAKYKLMFSCHEIPQVLVLILAAMFITKFGFRQL